MIGSLQWCLSCDGPIQLQLEDRELELLSRLATHGGSVRCQRLRSIASGHELVYLQLRLGPEGAEEELHGDVQVDTFRPPVK